VLPKDRFLGCVAVVPSFAYEKLRVGAGGHPNVGKIKKTGAIPEKMWY
jgi:hypothetical protein